jgi:hypothetical protein
MTAMKKAVLGAARLPHVVARLDGGALRIGRLLTNVKVAATIAVPATTFFRRGWPQLSLMTT